MFLRALENAQTPKGNSIGDVMSTFYDEITYNPNTVHEIFEQYIRGVIEFGGTLVRTVFTQSDGGLFPGNNSTIPESMRATTTGTFRYQTIGWHQGMDAGAAIFLAPTVVALLSIITVVVTVKQNAGRKLPPKNEYFDAGDILHVIGAASGTRLRDSYPEFSGDIAGYSENVYVTLGPVKDGKTGFITS